MPRVSRVYSLWADLKPKSRNYGEGKEKGPQVVSYLGQLGFSESGTSWVEAA